MSNRLLIVFMLAMTFLVPCRGTCATEAVLSPPGISGRLGYALLDLQTSKTYGHNVGQRFPMQSVFKCILGVKVLQEVDAGRMNLDQPVTVRREDLAMQWSPISKDFSGTSQTFTVRELIGHAVGYSDNTAADKLMRMVGGPSAVTEMLREAGITGIRVDRYEREFQAELVGLPAYKEGEVIDESQFTAAQKAVPRDKQLEAMDRYVSSEDPRDSATPMGAVMFLAKLSNGDLLSSGSTAYLLDVMTKSPSGAKRLKAGLPTGAVFAHKTGTGGDYHGINTGTNDIGIVTLADGRKFAIACFLAGSKAPPEERESIHSYIAHRLFEQVVEDLPLPEGQATTFGRAYPSVARLQPSDETATAPAHQ